MAGISLTFLFRRRLFSFLNLEKQKKSFIIFFLTTPFPLGDGVEKKMSLVRHRPSKKMSLVRHAAPRHSKKNLKSRQTPTVQKKTRTSSLGSCSDFLVLNYLIYIYQSWLSSIHFIILHSCCFFGSNAVAGTTTRTGTRQSMGEVHTEFQTVAA